ncbi:hypothetical protein D3C80_1516190 [compost metagenome]
MLLPVCEMLVVELLVSNWSDQVALALPFCVRLTLLASPKLWSTMPSLSWPFCVTLALLLLWLSCHTSTELPVPPWSMLIVPPWPSRWSP